jgi:hypothetical protein
VCLGAPVVVTACTLQAPLELHRPPQASRPDPNQAAELESAVVASKQCLPVIAQANAAGGPSSVVKSVSAQAADHAPVSLGAAAAALVLAGARSNEDLECMEEARERVLDGVVDCPVSRLNAAIDGNFGEGGGRDDGGCFDQGGEGTCKARVDKHDHSQKRKRRRSESDPNSAEANAAGSGEVRSPIIKLEKLDIKQEALEAAEGCAALAPSDGAARLEVVGDAEMVQAGGESANNPICL